MSGKGHNSKVKAGPVSAGRVKSFVERIEKLEEERKAIGGDIRDVYAEAKGVGYDVKTLRWTVQERRLDAADRAERDSLRDIYAHALGMAVDAVQSGELSAREAADKYGVGKTSVYKEIRVRDLSAREMTEGDLGEWLPDHDATAGEIMEGSAPVAASEKEVPSTNESCGGRGVAADAHDNPPPHGLAPSVGAGHDQQTQAVADRRDRAAPDVGNVAEPEPDPASAPRLAPPQDPTAEDDLEIPPFLRRLSVSA